MKLAKWVKPNSSEVRIYINDVSSLFMKKAWIVNEDGRWSIKSFDVFGNALDALYDEVEDFLYSLNNGERFSDFTTVLNLVK